MSGKIVLLGALLFAFAAHSGARAQPPTKNVVLIVGDDHGRDMGCYGNPDVKTPNLDRLAAEGTRFDFAFCTTPSCSPSRSVILSGLQNHANGMYGLQHATHKQTSHAWVRGLPNLLRDAGYRTAISGKYHVAPEDSYRFETSLNEGSMGSRNGLRMAEAAEKWIRQDDSKPFFLYFCPTDPHRAAKGFANDRPYPGIRETEYDPAAIRVPAFLPDRSETRRDIADYYQAVSRLDQGVGRLMKALDDTGHREDTLVIYMSDNGIPFPGAKTSMYDPGIRLPLLVRAPGARPAVARAMVTWADITPTILEFTGAKSPAYPLHGRSFLGALGREDTAGWDEIYASHQFHEITMYYPVRVVRTQRHKYMLNLASPLPFPFASDLYGSPTWQAHLRSGDPTYGRRRAEAYIHRPRHELYDLEADPQEIRNLAADPKHAALLAGLQEKLRKWQEKTSDPWLVKYTHE